MKWRLALVSILLAHASLAEAQEPLPAEPDPEPEASPEYGPGEAEAAPEPAPEAEVTVEPALRKGFLGGAAFGLGSVKLSCSNGVGCGHYAGIGFSVDAGYAFAPKWAIVGEIWFTGGVSNADSDVAGQLWTFSANVRYWVLERFWLQGGLAGTSFDMLRSGHSTSVASGGGGGLLLGAGAELWRSSNGHLVVDLRAKLGLMSVSDSSLGDLSGKKVGARQTTAMVTLSWY